MHLAVDFELILGGLQNGDPFPGSWGDHILGIHFMGKVKDGGWEQGDIQFVSLPMLSGGPLLSFPPDCRVGPLP